MFNRKIKCFCGKKINRKYEYCPYCGTSLEKVKENQGLIKKREKELDEELDRLTKELSESFGMPFLSSFPFKMFVKKLSKDIEKQFKEIDEDIAKSFRYSHKIPENAKETRREIIKDGRKIGDIKEFNFPGGHGFSIQINLGGMPQLKDGSGKGEFEESKLIPRKISAREAKKLAKLPREEPETTVRRLTDRIIYEIKLPGVTEKKNVFITRLQNSIEIKAFTKDKAYFKLIPISLPIKDYRLENGKLILELQP